MTLNEFSPLLNQKKKNTSTMKIDQGEEAIVVTSDSTENILSSNNDSPSIKKSVIRFLCTFIRIFFPSIVFLKFFLASIIPALSDQLIPLFYTGQIPNQSSLALAGQFTFISIILEVIQEGIVNSLFHFVGKNYKENRIASLGALKICFCLLIGCGCILTGVVLAFTDQFVRAMNTPSEIIELTKTFLWICSFSFPLMLLNAAIMNFLYITTSSLIILAQLIQVLTSFFLNFFLFAQGTSWSLNWGLDQLGFYKVLQSGVNLIVNIIFLHLVEKMSPKYFWWTVPVRKNISRNFSDLFAVSWGNFGDSAVRNFFYFVVTLKFTNSLGSNVAGAWNLLNTIIWGVLLLPMNSIAQLVKVQVGHAAEGNRLKSTIKRTAKEAIVCLTAWMSLISVLSYLFWNSMAAYFSQSNKEVQELSATMFKYVGWCYIIFSFNTVLDSLFYGTGKTKYVFYQSLITNLIVYFPPWILYETSVILPSFWLVMGLFMGGMLVDFSLTFLFSVRLWRKIHDD